MPSQKIIATLHTFSVNKIWTELQHVEVEESIKDFWQLFLKDTSKIIVFYCFFYVIAYSKCFKKTKYSSDFHLMEEVIKFNCILEHGVSFPVYLINNSSIPLAQSYI